MVEVPLSFGTLLTWMIRNKREASVTLKIQVHEKTNLTMVLGCTASGKKFAPMEILKGKTVLKEKFPAGVAVQVSQKGWMDEDTTKKWMLQQETQGLFSSMRDLGCP